MVVLDEKDEVVSTELDEVVEIDETDIGEVLDDVVVILIARVQGPEIDENEGVDIIDEMDDLAEYDEIDEIDIYEDVDDVAVDGQVEKELDVQVLVDVLDV